MATFRFTAAAVVAALALWSSATHAQQRASVSLTHTVVVTVPPRVKVQVAAAANKLQSQSAKPGLAVRVNATRGWVLVVGSKKRATSSAQWVANSGQRSSSMVVYRNAASGSPETGTVSDSEPIMLTVVAL